MSVIKKFARQSATLETYTGRDGFGKATYAPARRIKVRREAASGVRRSATGTDVDVETYYITEATVTIRDKIDGKAIRRIREVTNAKGNVDGVELWV